MLHQTQHSASRPRGYDFDMKTKAAVLKKPFEISTEVVELPLLGPKDMLVKIDACGVCPFDVRLYKGLSKAN